MIYFDAFTEKQGTLTPDGGLWMKKIIKRSLKHSLFMDVAPIDLNWQRKIAFQEVEHNLYEFCFTSISVFYNENRDRFHIKAGSSKPDFDRPTGFRDHQRIGKLIFSMAVFAKNPEEAIKICLSGFNGQFKLRSDKVYTGRSGDKILPLWPDSADAS